MQQTPKPAASTTEATRATEPIVVRDAVKRFGDVQALAGVSFAVRPGELVGLLGPNGAGKTTLIRAVAGRIRLDQGEVRLFGRVLTPADPRAELGVVPQELAIYPLLTAAENLRAFGALYGVARRDLDARVAWALQWADLADRASEPTRRFSGGMKRRLNIACGLIHRPKVVLLDEPTVGVDPQSRERIYEMLAALQADGVAVVLTTHHLEEAERRCERVVIIDHGRIVAAGTLAELVEHAIGGPRTMRVTLAEPWPDGRALPEGARLDAGRRVLTASGGDSTAGLARLATAIQAAGGDVRDLAMGGGSLQDVFIALTGRELRE